ncbi:MAG: hypothetical protein Q9207_005062, partial [Kuettlingeria erythrocarpa]
LLYAYPITGAGKISPLYTVTPIPALTFLFSLNFLNSDKRLMVTNPRAGSPGAAVLQIAYPSLKASVEELVTIPRQRASCWVAYAPRYSEYAYVMDAAMSNVTIVDPRVGRVEEVAKVYFETPTAGAGPIDTKIDRRWLYALTDDPVDSRVNVWELESEGRGLRLVQGFEIFREVAMLPWRMGLAAAGVGTRLIRGLNYRRSGLTGHGVTITDKDENGVESKPEGYPAQQRNRSALSAAATNKLMRCDENDDHREDYVPDGEVYTRPADATHVVANSISGGGTTGLEVETTEEPFVLLPY